MSSTPEIRHSRPDTWLAAVSTLIVRGWMAAGLASDPALRILGALIGLGVVAALFASARMVRAGFPTVSLS